MEIENLMKLQQNFFATNTTKSIQFRKQQLQKLKDIICCNEENICKALQADLGKSAYESWLTELGVVKTEINILIKNLSAWAAPQKKKTPISHFGSTSFTVKEPYGVVLILSPWNYPVQLTLAPLAGAIAAGNCAVIKCSPDSKVTTKLLTKLINTAFAKEYIQCIDETQSYEQILAQPYDYIFFTGSERVGKIVMEAAAKHTTPLTLELGGKSPCFVDATADIMMAAKRIVWGKGLNSGQTCVAPDYVLVDETVKSKFIQALKNQAKLRFPQGLYSKDYPKIINEHHFNRLQKFILEQPAAIGGHTDKALQKIEFTIFPACTFGSPIMQEEIFGPILPIIAYQNLDQAIGWVKQRAKPLACYIFTQSATVERKIISQVSFGGGCVNDTIMHLANHYLPFGGVGSSGMGAYHGKYSFDTFSHEKSILKSSTKVDIPMRYFPYEEKLLPLIKFIMR